MAAVPKGKIKSALWQGFGFAVGAAIFVPLIQMGMKKAGVNL